MLIKEIFALFPRGETYRERGRGVFWFVLKVPFFNPIEIISVAETIAFCDKKRRFEISTKSRTETLSDYAITINIFGISPLYIACRSNKDHSIATYRL